MPKLNLPVVITPSRAELGTRCHRRHFLNDALCRVRGTSASLEFGSVIHAGAFAYWLKRDWREAITNEWNTRFEGPVTPDFADKLSLEMALAMGEFYVNNVKLAGPYQEAADDWQLVDVEQRFEIPIKDAVLSFQCDRLVYSKSQDWLLVGDLKTAGRLDARWEKQWETSLQMKLYAAGTKTVFDHYGQVSVFIEGLYKHVPSDIRYFACPDWSQGLLQEAIFNAHNVAQMDEEILIRGHEAQLVVPVHRDHTLTPEKRMMPNVEKIEELAVRYTPVNYGDCYSYNQECPYRRICVADLEERVGILRSEYTVKEVEDY